MSFRKAVLLGLLSMLLPFAVHAAPPPANTAGSTSTMSANVPPPVFGSANCPMHVPCPGESGYASSSDLAANASSCITQFFGYSAPDGMFEKYTGVSGDGCLTTKPNVIPKGMGGQLSPHCCIIKQRGDYCSFHCDLIPQQ